MRTARNIRSAVMSSASQARVSGARQPTPGRIRAYVTFGVDSWSGRGGTRSRAEYSMVGFGVVPLIVYPCWGRTSRLHLGGLGRVD
jgi:hypothetical protein